MPLFIQRKARRVSLQMVVVSCNPLLGHGSARTVFRTVTEGSGFNVMLQRSQEVENVLLLRRTQRPEG
jgi:hypothetical protein